MPNLIEMQKHSYEGFLQKEVDPDKREDIGLQAVFKGVFPIGDFSGLSSLEFVSYTFDKPKYDIDECLAKGLTYETPIKITVRLVVYDVDKDTGARSIRDIKEQEVYFGTLPLMTDNGTFIINGTERVIVSQLHRSPGVFFDHDKGKTHSSGKLLYSARIIPLRGSWIDMEFDPKDILHVRIDRRRKFPVTLLLKALGYSAKDLLRYFYKTEKIRFEGKRVTIESDPSLLLGYRAVEDIVDPNTKEVIVKKNKKITQSAVRKMTNSDIHEIPAKYEDFFGRYAAHDVIDPSTGEVILGLNEEFNEEAYYAIQDAGIKEIEVLYIDKVNVGSSLRDTLLLDKVNTQEEAILEIYRKLRPSNPPTQEVANVFFENLFFNPEHYDLSVVGRLKLNLRLNLETDLTVRTLRNEDIMSVVKELIDLKDRQGVTDDIDHLGNRRVRAVGELLENQYRIGLVRMERAIRERMSLQEVETLMPHDLINSKPVSAVVKEFFGTSQLSQFMDQTNPLSEVTHKRRLSALGPGGLTRERAGFEVRDVHPSHYGRICPIETPEGPNIGLIVSLATYARVNPYGFIETPYRLVKNGQAASEVKYLTALDEKEFPIAQANALLDKKNRFVKDVVSCRVSGEFVQVPSDEVVYMDVSPNQLVSVSTSLIPFLENDDANRALMGSNMQRQAVPLLRSEAPLVGTGMETVVARDSGVNVVAQHDGIIDDVDASRIVLKYQSDGGDGADSGVDIYKLTKYQRSNQNTCFNQRSIVRPGDYVTKGQIIADGPATELGELALGRNVVVAFMSWGGYNFEDSILVSERLVKDDVFTSIHIEEFETMARDTKLGKEEISRDIPNLGEESLKDLDLAGIIRVGAEVKPGDILVGKVTPKTETQLSPEEKLLRAIFGEKASDVKDTSLHVPPGIEGVVIDARVFSRKGVDKDDRAQSIEDNETARLEKDMGDEIQIIKASIQSRLAELLIGKTLSASLTEVKKGGGTLIKRGTKINHEHIEQIEPANWANVSLSEDKERTIREAVGQVISRYNEQVDMVKMTFHEKITNIRKGDELPPGVIKMVKVYIAMKRKLSVGDKMAGRHGNKGVVSRILPEEDMPYFEDGTPVDIVLNPLGVPSRMNVGQVLETHLGWASKELGRQISELLEKLSTDKLRTKLKSILGRKDFKKYVDKLDDEELGALVTRSSKGLHVATPVFDGASEEEIRDFLKMAGLPVTGKTYLRDGRTGERFDSMITVGVMYVLKLHHLVDDKLHARSIGPYSLVTQQPLGGKAQFGGQRLGEMEVWAMEAYGAAYSLQEFLTVKSDDTIGRTRMYEKIVKGDNVLEAGIPESFNVLVKELMSLGLDVELIEDSESFESAESADD
ncbi:MAG: DNA-directed RNA polymerase subunit beta [Deltaproteobacteria bacterium]|nr:DNA-directed RNA polymerase subunit beta [Deltaproteobacteria bacterium]